MPIAFTQRMTMHLNGGSKFSELRFDILADGKPTTLKRVTRTNGRPKYMKTQDLFWDTCDPDAFFDMLAAKGVGVTAWLESRVAAGATTVATKETV